MAPRRADPASYRPVVLLASASETTYMHSHDRTRIDDPEQIIKFFLLLFVHKKKSLLFCKREAKNFYQ